MGFPRRNPARPLKRRVLVGLIAGAIALPAATFEAIPVAATTLKAPSVDVLEATQWVEAFPAGAQTVHIVGQVRNSTSDNVALVRIGLNLLDAKGATLKTDTAWASLDLLSPQEVSPFETVLVPAPADYSTFAVTGVTFARATATPYHANLPVTIGACPWSASAAVVCGSVTNGGAGAVSVENVRVALTLFGVGGAMVAQNRVPLSSTPSAFLASGQTGTFSVDRTGEPAYASMVTIAEPTYPVDLNPASLAFGNQFVKTTSPVKTVTVTNTGSRALAIQTISAPSDFGVTSNCPTNLPALPSCNVAVAFTPSVRAAESGFLSITSDGAGSPDTIPLSGTGIAPVVSLVATAGLDFGNVAVGTTSTPKPITLTNVGSAPLMVTRIALSNDFWRPDPNACLGSLDINASCVINVAFTPTLAGPRNGTLTLTDNALDSPQQLVLTGVGLGKSIVFNPPSLTFDGNVAVSQLTVTVINTGTVGLTITGVSTDVPFSASGCTPWPLTLAPQASCVITVTFDATIGTSSAPGMVAGALHVSDSLGEQYLLLLGNTGAGRGPIQSTGAPRTNPPPPPPPKS